MLTIDLAILHSASLYRFRLRIGVLLANAERHHIALLCQELVMVYDVNPCDNSALYGCKYHRNNTREGGKNSRYLQAGQQEDQCSIGLHT